MALKTLLVQNLRIIQQLDISLAANANLFIGENGAGKTSILEAIDILSRGRSFRERRILPLIKKHTDELVVSSKLSTAEGETHLGIQKSTKQTLLHVNQEKVASISIHASHLPVVSMHPDSHQVIQGGAKHRRNYLDWSAFHVKPTFLSHWRNYNKCLRQRNQLLRNQCTDEEISVWTMELSEHAKHVDHARSMIFKEINPIFEEYGRRLLPETEIRATYQRGWYEGQELQHILQEELPKERQAKTTRFGAHRANLKITLNDLEAASIASRGQQKLIAACLILAQIEHLQNTTSQKCMVLLDDIRAELDQEHAHALLSAMQDLGCQVFITALDLNQVDLTGWEDNKVFHVEQGVCKPMNK